MHGRGVVASIVSLVFRTRSIQGPEATDVTYYTGVLMICKYVFVSDLMS